MLAPVIWEILPLGGYAEPASSNGTGGPDQSLKRCLRFARDGWSVVRIVEHSLSDIERVGRIRELSESLIAIKAPTDIPVLLFPNGGNDARARTEVPLGALNDLIAGHSVENRLSIAFSNIGTGVAPHIWVASSNGIAG